MPQIGETGKIAPGEQNTPAGIEFGAPGVPAFIPVRDTEQERSAPEYFSPEYFATNSGVAANSEEIRSMIVEDPLPGLTIDAEHGFAAKLPNAAGRSSPAGNKPPEGE